MLVRSNPRNPSAMLLVGTYAEEQNAANRSNTEINESMDNGFKPMHDLWTSKWETQNQLEAQVSEAVQDREGAARGLRYSTTQVHSMLVGAYGKDSPQLKQYLPGGTLEVNSYPLDEQLSTLSLYVSTITSAPDAVIPPQVRSDFNTKYDGARSAQSRVQSLEQAALDAQRARAALDPQWLAAYNGYRIDVEHACRADRGKIQTWIKLWPEQVTSSSQTAEEKAAARELEKQVKLEARAAKAAERVANAQARAELKARVKAAKKAAREAAREAKRIAKEAAGAPLRSPTASAAPDSTSPAPTSANGGSLSTLAA